ncbi:MAG: DsbA family protein [Patescibacteria group bacterium]
MEENNIENKSKNSQQQIVGAILVVGVLIAGAILLKGSKSSETIAVPVNNNGVPITTLAPVGTADRTLGNPQAKVTLILYEDFQCPFCGAVSGLVSNTDAIKYLKEKVDPNWTPFMPLINEHIKKGDVQFVYRDWAFLGPESIKSAEATRCAGDQGKFWEYHDYLYGHQNGENQGSFSDPNLKSFAKKLGLNSSSFDKCLDENKYAQAVADSKTEGTSAGVTGTPKGFILRDKKVVSTIDGAESFTIVKQKIESALK